MSFNKFRDLILGVVMLLFSGFYLFYAFQIKTRPKLVPSFASANVIPKGLGVLLGFLAVLCIIQGINRVRNYKPDENENKITKDDLISVMLTIAVIVIYTVMLPNLGFCLSTIIFLFLQMMVLAPKNKRNYLLFAVISVVFTAIVFVSFRVGLQQLLPRGVIEALIGF